MALPDQQHIFDSYPSPKTKLMEIAFLRNRRMHPKFVLAYLQLKKNFFFEQCKLATPLGFLQAFWVWFLCPSATSFLSCVASFVVDLLGFSLDWFFTLIALDKKGNVVLMHTRVRFFSGAKTNNIVVKHVYTRILGRAWSVWSGCEMTFFCYMTGTKIIYSVHKHYIESTWLWDFDWPYFVDLN